MATKHFCDRCQKDMGKEYDSLVRFHSLNGRGESWHVCEECLADFKRWLEGEE